MKQPRRHLRSGVEWVLVSLLFVVAPVHAAELVEREAPPASRRIIVRFTPHFAQEIEAGLSADTLELNNPSQRIQTWLAQHQLSRIRPVHPSRVRAKKAKGMGAQRLAQGVQARFLIRAARAPRGKTAPELTRTYVLEPDVQVFTEFQRLATELRASPEVEFAEAEGLRRTQFIPDDPYFSSSNSWSQPYGDLYGLAKLQCPRAWDTNAGEGVVVAVIDTGIDYTHAEITNNIWRNAAEIPGNNIDDDGNGFVDDVRGWDFIGVSFSTVAEDNDPTDGHGHGTHVAGTIAATGNDGVGIIGVAWRAQVMAVKGLADDGSGPDAVLAEAIAYATDNGADIINASWGGAGDSEVLREAIEYAYAQGVVFVAAAGNSSADIATFRPSGFSEVISVAASDYTDARAYFSNFGERLDVAAPGVDILSLRAQGTTLGTLVGTQYARANGTSMAAPHTAGLIALVLSQRPAYSIESIRQLLHATADDVGVAGPDIHTGFGRVNAHRALTTLTVLETRLLSPAWGTAVSSPTNIIGTAQGPNFDEYLLEYGAGTNPLVWTEIAQNTTPVNNASLGVFNPSDLPDGLYTVRLRAFDTLSNVFQDRLRLEVDYVSISNPPLPLGIGTTRAIKSGVPIPIYGTARGRTFRRFRLEWAPGARATFGWSATGFTLVGAGNNPITNGFLGTWNSGVISQGGFYTIRLTAENQHYTSEAKTFALIEPDLLSTNWPMWLDQGPDTYTGILPARNSNGTFRLMLANNEWFGNPPSAKLWSLSPDGVTASSLKFRSSSDKQPAVGDFDAQPGDEVVMVESARLLVVRQDGSSNALPPTLGGYFSKAPVTLADVDGDGTREALTFARDGGNAIIYAWKTNGQHLNPGFPITFPDSNLDRDFFSYNPLLAVDLNNDGRKEILVIAGIDSQTFYVRAYNSDGTSRTWSPTNYTPARFTQWGAGDLDRDGEMEVVMSYHDMSGWNSNRIAVFRPDGALKPGWPITPGWYSGGDGTFAIGDLDRDGKDEVVIASYHALHAAKWNGTSLGPNWPLIDSARHIEHIALADVNGDGFPEALTISTRLSFSWYDDDIQLVAYNRDATVVRRWNLSGVRDSLPDFKFHILTGDFDQNGRLDIVVSSRLITAGGWLKEGIVSVLSPNTPYNPLTTDWPMNLADPQNSAMGFTMPRLDVERTAGGARLSWPASRVAFQLQSTAAFQPSQWSNVSVSVTLSNARHNVTVPTTNAARYYRIRPQ